jgi:hypothetical protein
MGMKDAPLDTRLAWLRLHSRCAFFISVFNCPAIGGRPSGSRISSDCTDLSPDALSVAVIAHY